MRKTIPILFFYAIQLAHANPSSLTISAIVAAPDRLPANGFSAVTYKITNNTSTQVSTNLIQVSGMTQITTPKDACQIPIFLDPGQSCHLYLRLQADQIQNKLQQHPMICSNLENPNTCTLPDLKEQINLQISAPLPQNNWIEVLIAENPPPNDPQGMGNYVSQISKLAPSLKQIHLRIPPGNNNLEPYVSLANALKTAYGSNLLLGYHPDNGRESYQSWGCANQNWACVLNASIQNMNTINAQLGVNAYSIFSIEQSYAEPEDNVNYHVIKNCLNPQIPQANSTYTCPSNVVKASPTVKFGNVLPSYGSCSSTPPCMYGSDALDYGYPQYYNLYKQIKSGTQNLITNGYFPSDSIQNCTTDDPNLTDFTVVDVILSPSTVNNHIPYCNNPYPNTYNNSGPSPSLAANYFAFFLTQLPPLVPAGDLNQAQVFITLSGEPAFLGGSGWTLATINQFYQSISTNLQILHDKYQISGYENYNLVHYGIWNFDAILANEE